MPLEVPVRLFPPALSPIVGARQTGHAALLAPAAAATLPRMKATSSSRGGRATLGAVVRGNVLWLSVVSLLNDTASEMIYPLLPLFLVGTLGATPAMLGAIEGVAESTSAFLKLGSGHLSDRLARRRPLVLWGYGLAAVVRPLVALVTAPWQVLLVRFTDRVGKGLRSAPRDALLAESVPPAAQGAAFGVHRAADHAGAVAGPLLAAGLLVLLAGDLRTVFLLAFIPGFACVLILALLVRESPRPVPPRRAAEPLSARLRSAWHSPVAPYLVVLALFTLGNATDAFLLLRAQELGVPVAAIPLLWGAHHVSKMLWSVPGGLLADRLGARRAILAGWLLYAATYAGFAFASTAAHAWALFLVYGMFYGLTEAPEKLLIAQLAPAERRGAAFGGYHFAIGIAALPASLIFGGVWTVYGARWAFLLGAALALAAALLLAAVVRPPARSLATGA